MPQIKMMFVVDKVTNVKESVGDCVECSQADPGYVNPNYRNCKLTLGIINDDELKHYGPGATFEAILNIL